MITSYRSKALKVFATTGNGSKLPVQKLDRVARILSALDVAKVPENMNLPGLRFHALQGNPRRFAVDASADYRITFGWIDGHAVDVDIEDYH